MRRLAQSWGDAPQQACPREPVRTSLHRGHEGPPEQPEGRERADSDRRGHGRHRCRGGRQVVARLRRAVRRGPPPLRRDLQSLRPPVPGAARPAAGRADRGRAAGRGGRSHGARADLALDRRHDDLRRRLPARALRTGRHAALPPVRRAGRARLAVLDLRRARKRRGPDGARHVSAPRRRRGDGRGRTRGLREGGAAAGAGERRDRPDRGRPPATRGRRDHGGARPDRDRAREPPAHRGLDRGRPASRRGPRRPARRGRARDPPLQRGAALRALRHRLRRPDAGPVLFQQSRGRLPDLQGLRAHDGDRPRAGDPRPAPDARRRGREAVPDQLLQRLPGRPRALPEARGAARGRALGGAAATRATPDLGRRAGRAQQLAAEVVRHRRVLRLARVEDLQDARPCPALALPQLPDLPRLRRIAAAARGAPVPGRRTHAAGAGSASGRGQRTRLPRVVGARQRSGLRAAARRDPRPPALPGRRRARLSHARPPVTYALGRRGAARHARHRPRRIADEHALRARRAVGGPARPRRGTALGRAAAPRRGRQRGRRRRARPGADRLGRPRDRPRPWAGKAGGRARLRGTARRPAARAALAHRCSSLGAGCRACFD